MCASQQKMISPTANVCASLHPTFKKKNFFFLILRIWIGLFLIHRSLRFLGVGGSVDIYVRRVLCKLRAHLYRNSTFFFLMT